MEDASKNTFDIPKVERKPEEVIEHEEGIKDIVANVAVRARVEQIKKEARKAKEANSTADLVKKKDDPVAAKYEKVVKLAVEDKWVESYEDLDNRAQEYINDHQSEMRSLGLDQKSAEEQLRRLLEMLKGAAEIPADMAGDIRSKLYALSKLTGKSWDVIAMQMGGSNLVTSLQAA